MLWPATLGRASAEVHTLKPAEELREEDVAQAPYDLKHLSGPLLTGPALITFRLLCESTLFKEVLYVIYANKNCLLKVLTGTVIPEAPKPTGVPELPWQPETNVAPVADAHSPAARVRAALECLGLKAPALGCKGPARHLRTAGAFGPGGKGHVRPTIMEYHAAYMSGDITPSAVAEEVIRFVEREEGAANWLCDFRPAHLRAQAAAATARYAAGAPLSVLDGVPFAVKDVVDTYAHTSGSGTAFLGDMRGAVADVALEAPCVAALRSLGALCVGKTQMQEFGLLPTGISAKLGLARNPQNLSCIPGGSSGGSACVVAAGVCAFAIGTDGGGSIRIPAALCGVVGYKPTQGRMASEPEGCSLVTLGPIACSVEDAMIVYAAMACPGSCFRSPLGLRSQYCKSLGGAAPAAAAAAAAAGAPPGSRTAAEAAAEVRAAAAAAAAAAKLPPPGEGLGEAAARRPPLALPIKVVPEGARAAGLAQAKPLAGVRIGIFKQWFDDAEPRVVAACQAAVGLLEGLGAKLVEVAIPELDQIRVAHLVLFLSECYALNKKVAMTPALRSQAWRRGCGAGALAALVRRLVVGWWPAEVAIPELDQARVAHLVLFLSECYALNKKLHEDSRVILSVASKFTGADYLQALRVRNRASAHWRRAFEGCDFIVTPATASVAPTIPAGSLAVGMLDLTQCSKLVRFTQPANVLGHPAIAIPVGADTEPGPCNGGAPTNLPISLQLIGRPWHDASLLRAGCLLEAALRQAGVREPLPPVLVNPLAAAKAAEGQPRSPRSPRSPKAAARGRRGSR